MDERDASYPDVATPSARTITRAFVRVRRAKHDRLELAPAQVPKPTYSYLTRMLALAHALECRIEEWELDGRQALARKLGMSPARLAVILDLSLLAPDIQREIACAPPQRSVWQLSLRSVRPLTLERSWGAQRKLWSELRSLQPD